MDKKGVNEEVEAESAREGAEIPETPAVTENNENTEEKHANVENSEEKIARLEAKAAELNDQYLRKAADFENFRKRMFKEKQESIDFANQNLLLDIIPVLDDFERALKSAQDGGRSEADFQNLLEGISMIQQRLLTSLENKWDLKRFDSKDAVFDPSRHEALMMEKSADVTEAIVQEDLIKGYTLKDRVVRTAKVKVLMPLE
jgi:molecular chaperone GrpE